MRLLLSRTLIWLYVNIMIIMPPVWLLLSMLPLFQTFIIYIYIGECVCVCLSVCLSVYPSGRIHVAACGPIATKFGTRMEIHLEMVMGEIKKLPRVTLGEFRGF